LIVSQLSVAQSAKRGLTVSYGRGAVSNYVWDRTMILSSVDYVMNVELGYKLRLEYEKPFFIDFDLDAGLHKIKSFYWFDTGSDDLPVLSMSGTTLLWSNSLDATWTYRLYKGLSAGVGLVPTFYFSGYGTYSFDFPLTAKIGYDWKFIGLSLSYRYGFTNSIKAAPDFTKGKISYLQVKLFIPLS